MDEMKMLSFPLLSFEMGKQTKKTLNDVGACDIFVKGALPLRWKIVETLIARCVLPHAEQWVAMMFVELLIKSNS